jgi:hypothetical protein
MHAQTSFRIIVLLSGLAITACHAPTEKAAEAEEVRTVVTTTHIRTQPIAEYIHLNGVSLFQKRDNIRTNITGYIRSLRFKKGDYIKSGQLFCMVATKEQDALKHIITSDTSLNKFQHPIPAISNVAGIITAIGSVEGDYISEGDILATVSEPTSLVVQVNVPYEYNQYVTVGKSCILILPDGRKIKSVISGELPTVDATSQAQTFYIRLPNEKIPENLNVTVLIAEKQNPAAQCLPSTSVQTDELQQKFWVMKVINDSMAVKSYVKIGVQNDSLTEIISNELTPTDLIIQEGAYGLADSTIILLNK